MQTAEKSTVAEIPLRSEVPTELTWDLTSVYTSEEAWNADEARVRELLKRLPEFKGKLKRSGKQILAFLTLRDEAGLIVERLYTYSHLKADEDKGNSHFQALNEKAASLFTLYSSAISFSRPELLSIDPTRLRNFIAKTRGLSLYSVQLEEMIRQRDHVRSSEVEEILAQYSQVGRGPRNTFSMLDNADLKLPKVVNDDGQEQQLTHGNYVSFLHSRNPKVREAAYRGMMGAFEGMRNTIASNYSTHVNGNIFEARSRNYPTAIASALGPDNIPLEVYTNLVDTAHKYLPLVHRYLAIRKKMLAKGGELGATEGGAESKLRMWDLYVPLVGEVDYKVDYPTAQKTILSAVAPLGTEYVKTLAEGFGSRWVDVMENKGKRSGAYSSGCYGTAPYMLMNWQDNLENMFTLAHEAGHSMHSWHTRKHQPYQYGDYTIFVAEVASTCNEALLTHFLLNKEGDRNVRKYLINHQLEAFRTTFFRQTLFAEFEMKAHALAEQGVALTADKLSEIFLELNKLYYGDVVADDDPVAIEWARIPHFYSSFYVYKYATGISAATALASQILSEGKPALDRYLKFLSGGSSDSSINLLKGAGVDLSSPKAISSALDVFADYLNQFEKLVDEDNASSK
jgi:oligoendopeptidase F